MSSILLPRNGGDVVCVYTGTPTSNQYLAWNSTSATFVPTTLSAGSPGGADTQVQFNSSGAFAGDAKFTYNPASHLLHITGHAHGYDILQIFTSDSNSVFYATDYGNGYGRCIFGYPDGATNIDIVSDPSPTGYITLSSDGLITLGDTQGFGHSSLFVVDDANSKTTSNVKHEASGDITVMTNGQGLHQQSPNGHYWRLDISNAGAATWTDIGTSPP